MVKKIIKDREDSSGPGGGNTRLALKQFLDKKEGTFDGVVVSAKRIIELASQTFPELCEGAREEIKDIQGQISSGELSGRELAFASQELAFQESLLADYYETFANDFKGLPLRLEEFIENWDGSNQITQAEAALFQEVLTKLDKLAGWYKDDKYGKLKADFKMKFVQEDAEKLAEGAKVMTLTDREAEKLHEYLVGYCKDDEVTTRVLEEVMREGIKDAEAQAKYYRIFVKMMVPDHEAKTLAETLRGLSDDVAMEIGQDYIKGREEDLDIYKGNAITLGRLVKSLEDIMKQAKIQPATGAVKA